MKECEMCCASLTTFNFYFSEVMLSAHVSAGFWRNSKIKVFKINSILPNQINNNNHAH